MTTALVSGVLGAIREIANWTSPDIHVGTYRLNVYFLIALAALVWVQLDAWRDEKQRVEELTRENENLEDQLRDKRNRAAIRERLSYSLELGALYVSSLEYASDRFNVEFERLKIEKPDKATLDRRVAELLSDDSLTEVREWASRVGEYLNTEFDRSKRVLFEGDVGLQVPPPPAGMEPYFARYWQGHQLRLQRLHQFIEELQD